MSETKILLTHPQGKKGVSMHKEKYEPIHTALMEVMKGGKQYTHAQLKEAVTALFKKKKLKFEGSLEWHMEWVKLDMEAKGKVLRKIEGSSLLFCLKAK